MNARSRRVATYATATVDHAQQPRECEAPVAAGDPATGTYVVVVVTRVTVDQANDYGRARRLV